MTNSHPNKMKYRETKPSRHSRGYRGVIGADPIATLAVVGAIRERQLAERRPSLLARLLGFRRSYWIGGAA